MERRKSTVVSLLIVVCLLTLLWPLEGKIENDINKIRPHRSANNILATAGAGELPGIYRFFQLAGLNSLLADILWMKADDLWHSSSWWQMGPVMEAITRIDPKFIMVWRIMGWHYGWNLNDAAPNPVEKEYWLQRAAEIYEQGVKENPKDYGIHWDRDWFYADRKRDFKRAAECLEEDVKLFPDQITTMDRTLQHMYERSWRVDDAVQVIKEIQRKSPNDQMARRDLDWWKAHHDDINWRWVLEVREHYYNYRYNRPPFRNPFEGTLVPSPPWRDWSQMNYINPDWQPNLQGFSVDSLRTIFDLRPDLAKKYIELHRKAAPRTAARNNLAQQKVSARNDNKGLSGPPPGITPQGQRPMPSSQ